MSHEFSIVSKPLSPAAQEVKTVVMSCYKEGYVRDHAWPLERPKVVAALRALADHKTQKWDGTGPACFWRPTQDTRRELRNIADELEGHHG